MSLRTKLGLAIVAGLATSTSALAGISYSINPAEADQFGGNGGHTFWFPANGGAEIPNGGNTAFHFVDNSGVINFSMDMTSATMTGQLASVGDPTSVWDVEIRFILGMNNADFTNPMGHLNPNGGTSFGEQKRELNSAAYSENGGPVDASMWRYYYMDDDNATLTGVGGADDGEVLELSQRPGGNDYGRFVFQVGVGANGKNVNFGASTWFNYTGKYNGHGDINIDLKEIPTPGAASLAMISCGIAGARRRR